MHVRKVMVVGAGTMGSGIAHVFALHDFPVLLSDLNREVLESALGSISLNLDRQVRKGSIQASEKERALTRIRIEPGLKGAADADLIVEAAPEDLDLKASLFRELDRIAPADAILASNTSSISLTRLAAQTRRPEQVIGMHFMNPVPVMALVEVIRGLRTSQKTVDVVRQTAERLDKQVVEVRDFPGFISNRLLMPMINEAIYCLMEGVAEREAIDAIMTLGMNHPLGPLALADLIGLDTCLAIMEVLHQGLGDDKYRPCPLLRLHVDAGRLGRKSGEGFYRYD